MHRPRYADLPIVPFLGMADDGVPAPRRHRSSPCAALID